MEAISLAGTVLAILTKEGIVMVAEKASSHFPLIIEHAS
jgi:20S proteasome alpha/beta subunit